MPDGTCDVPLSPEAQAILAQVDAFLQNPIGGCDALNVLQAALVGLYPFNWPAVAAAQLALSQLAPYIC